MNCKNCYQEIPDGSKFCPHCGAKQNEVQPNAEQENAVKNDPVQATGAAKTTENAAGYQDAAGYQNNSGYQDAAGYQNNSGYQDVSGYQNNGGYQDAAGYQNNSGYQDVSGYQNNGGYQDAAGYQNNSGYQDAAGYQNNSGYQNVTGYQNNGQKPEINYVPYLVLSIISTVCCCLPFGIVGIVFSVKINSAMNAGNYEEAVQNAKMAKIWTIVSFVVGLVVGILYFMFGIIVGIDNYY